MNKYYTVNFAQAYGQSAYGDCVYNDTTSCQTSGGGTGTGSGTGSGSSSGGLANTGIMVVAFVTLACLIMFIALVVRLWRRPAKKVAAETVTTQSSDDDTNQL
jgi:preprotein translocase subunit SecG